jgi:proteic killer suppression protein
MGILNFKHKGLAELFVHGETNKLGARYIKNAFRILGYLDHLRDIESAKNVKDFHALKGKRKDTYSMHVTGNYCITFKWNWHDVYDVYFEDYH